MNYKRTSILWVTSMILDTYLHKKALLSITGQLADLGRGARFEDQS